MAYNDIDLCFKLTEQGYYNVVRNDAVLYHHESVSRGYDDDNLEKMQRLTKERNKLYEKHPQFYQKDCFYNENLSKTLADFSVDAQGRENDLNITVLKDKKDVLISPKADLISYSVNAVQVADVIRVEGFAFLQDKRFNNLRKVKVILAGGKHTYCMETEKTYRGRFKNEVLHKGKIGMTGFVTLAKTNLIEKGNYRIYLKIGGRICDTGREVSCS